MTSILAAARAYIAQGFRVIPIPHRQKGPVVKEWQSLVINHESLVEHFNGAAGNIGVIMGHGDVSDVDLDCVEAIAASNYLLPRTAVFGHASKPGSHYVYRCPGLASTEERAARKYVDPVTGGGLLELRTGGGGYAAQTVFPPSTHPSGEVIAWTGDARIATVQPDNLRNACARLAACSLLARHYPKEGARHGASLVLGGFFAGCGIAVPYIKLMAEAIGAASGQPREKIADMRRTAEDGAALGKRAGFPKLVEVFGKPVAERVAEWLGYDAPAAQPNGGVHETQRERAGSTHGDINVTLDDFYAYMPAHSYIFTPTREMWPAASINARIPPFREEKPIQASAWLDRNKPVEQMTWAPGEPMLIHGRLVSNGGWTERRGVACFNLYRPSAIEPGNADEAGPWLEHTHCVFGDAAGHIINWLAHRVQHPQEKINHALVLGGSQGVGKDTLLEPVKRAIGPWNFAEVSPQQMLGRFNGFLKSVILRVSEARDLGDVDRFQFYDHMKAYTAAPPDVLRVDEKHLREHAVFNCCGVIITTNHKVDGIYLPADDRRHFVAWSDRVKEDFAPAYWNGLWSWYERGGCRHVAAYLARLDISTFDAKAPPPKTSAFWDIVDANRAPEDAELADVLDEIGNPDVTTLSRITFAARGEIEAWLRDRKNRRIIPHRLEACGYVPVRNDTAKDGLWKVCGTRQVIYGKSALPLRDRLRAAHNLARNDQWRQ